MKNKYEDKTYFERIKQFWVEDIQFRQAILFFFVGFAVIILPIAIPDFFDSIHPRASMIVTLLGVGLSFFSTETLAKYSFILGGQDYEANHDEDDKK